MNRILTVKKTLKQIKLNELPKGATFSEIYVHTATAIRITTTVKFIEIVSVGLV